MPEKLIVLLMIALLVLPVLAAARRLRDLPRKPGDRDDSGRP